MALQEGGGGGLPLTCLCLALAPREWGWAGRLRQAAAHPGQACMPAYLVSQTWRLPCCLLCFIVTSSGTVAAGRTILCGDIWYFCLPAWLPASSFLHHLAPASLSQALPSLFPKHGSTSMFTPASLLGVSQTHPAQGLWHTSTCHVTCSKSHPGRQATRCLLPWGLLPFTRA